MPLTLIYVDFGAVEEHSEATEIPHGPLFGVADFTVFQAMARDAGFLTTMTALDALTNVALEELRIETTFPSTR